jgi:phosphatidylglycerol:prolipoprotein diacylglycerol transferase
MYPLVRIGPVNLSSGGLLLLLAIVVGTTLMERTARRRNGTALADQSSRITFPTLVGALIGGRLWYGLLNWDLYGTNPGLFLALRITDLAWPGALTGGILAAWLWCRWHTYDALAVADAATLGLLPAQVVACVGLLLSGEALGIPTRLPWGIDLFGVTRHPTQIYLALVALLSYLALVRSPHRTWPPGRLFMAYLGIQGVTLLLLEPLRADSLLLPYGIRTAQVAGLVWLLAALVWLRTHTRRAEPVGEPLREAG